MNVIQMDQPFDSYFDHLALGDVFSYGLSGHIFIKTHTDISGVVFNAFNLIVSNPVCMSGSNVVVLKAADLTVF